MEEEASSLQNKTVFLINDTFLLKRKIKEEWPSALTQRFIPFYLPSVMEQKLDVLHVGRSTVISSPKFYYSLDGSLL